MDVLLTAAHRRAHVAVLIFIFSTLAALPPLCAQVSTSLLDGPLESVTTRPVFRDEDLNGVILSRTLTFTNTTRHFSFYWGMPGKPRPYNFELDTNQVYTFVIGQHVTELGAMHVLEQDVIKELPFRRTNSELRRIVQNGRVLFDLEVCPVHEVKMAYRDLPIYYGLLLTPAGEPTFGVTQKLFPHHLEWIGGGCVLSTDSPKVGKKFVCDKCRAAYTKWKAEHPAPPPANPAPAKSQPTL